MCPAGHVLCATCLGNLVTHSCNLDDHDVTAQLAMTEGEEIISCPQATTGVCQHLSLDRVVRELSAEVLTTSLIPALRWTASRQGRVAALEETRVSDGDRAAAAERAMLQQALPNARQCGQCGYGPILHAHCDNLRTHHGQRVSGGSQINNACPRCNWFADDISAWPRWDGRMPNTALAAKPPSSRWSSGFVAVIAVVAAALGVLAGYTAAVEGQRQEKSAAGNKRGVVDKKKNKKTCRPRREE